jgi:hypothetical protein
LPVVERQPQLFDVPARMKITIYLDRIMTSPLVFNLASGSVSFGFTIAAARDLQSQLNQLLQILKAKTAATVGGSGSKPTSHPSIEYQYTGEIFLEIFCNPNIWPTPFAAKVLITLRDDRIRLSTEAELTHVIEDVNRFIEQYG